MAPDVVLVGAGIVGAACALELARGGVSVAVADPAFAGARAALKYMTNPVAFARIPT